MPGKSFIDSPESLSAQYQDFLRKQILTDLRDFPVDTLDLAGWMKSEKDEFGSVNWHYPHEGHLNPAGNELVADILLRRINK